jgi:hypothetical protein
MMNQPAPATEQSEILLQSRDVQALSRTFRRLAEIQDGLADHIRDLEEERQSRWMLPAVAIGSLVLGVGLAIVGLVWYQKQTPQQPVEVNLSSLPANSIQVQAPDQSMNQELLQQMLAQLEAMKASQTSDRRMIADLGGKVLESEMSALTMLKNISAMEAGMPLDVLPLPANARTPSEASDSSQADSVENKDGIDDSSTANEESTSPEKLGYPADAWLGALNGLITVDGYPHYRFQQASRVSDSPRLADTIFFVWDKNGLFKSIVRAETVDFYLQESTFSLRMHFQNGTRTSDGVKTAFPEGGLSVTLPDINVPAWVAHFPEIGPKGIPWEPVGQVPPPAPELVDPNPAGSDGNGTSDGNKDGEEVSPLERMRRSIDALVSKKQSFGFYHLERVGRFEGDALKMVRLSWYDSNGELFKYIEADTLRVRARGEGWVELSLEDGSFIRLGNKTPFHDSEYRIHLPDQDLVAWRATGMPIRETE